MKSRITIVALLLAVASSSCSDFLTGPGLTVNPNLPVSASKEQFFASVAASQESQEEGLLARLAAMFTQQMAGTGRQHATFQLYSITENDIATYMNRTYTGGGLVDIRQAEQQAKAQGDSTFAGISMVYEALMIGRAASIWGDIPYSEAVSNVATPKLDSQEQVYAAIQAKLDTAIAWIPKTGGTNVGPGAVDLVYGGDRAKWLAAANTLKARYYMHWVEAQLVGGTSAALATTACGGNCLQKAVASAGAGIQTSANDFRTFHSGTSTEWNFWYQFLVVARTGDVAASRTLIDTLRARRTTLGDQRVRAYFDSVAFQGAVDFRGADRTGATSPSGSPLSVLSSTRLANSFRQPIITAAENALWLAEAQARQGADAAALTALNQAKAASAASTGVAV
ncbi:MAG TPA: SusD/RagB family nutrient-binding outer membrane lipoprotein, partial [Gemmatimonadaceae bacterium]